MKSLKDKMYNYQVTPPSGSWQTIATALDEVNSNVQPIKKTNRIFYLSLAAAAVTFIIFSVFWFNDSGKKTNESVVKSTKIYRDSGNTKSGNLNGSDNKIKVPETNGDDNNLAANKKSKSGYDIKKYITISGPGGQPVKISEKVASLIVSSDDKYPPNTVWNSKVNEWRAIMKANNLTPTTANFLDIVELTNALKINTP
ncbi:MAG: hypothetical protein ABIN97_10865 [Ginsengibacter sp.]